MFLLKMIAFLYFHFILLNFSRVENQNVTLFLKILQNTVLSMNEKALVKSW